MLEQEQNPSLVTNLEPDEFEPQNLLYSVLAEKGFRLRFEPTETDSLGRVVEEYSAFHVDDIEEKDKVEEISEIFIKRKAFHIFGKFIMVTSNLYTDFGKDLIQFLVLVKKRKR